MGQVDMVMTLELTGIDVWAYQLQASQLTNDDMARQLEAEVYGLLEGAIFRAEVDRRENARRV